MIHAFDVNWLRYIRQLSWFGLYYCDSAFQWIQFSTERDYRMIRILLLLSVFCFEDTVLIFIPVLFVFMQETSPSLVLYVQNANTTIVSTVTFTFTRACTTAQVARASDNRSQSVLCRRMTSSNFLTVLHSSDSWPEVPGPPAHREKNVSDVRKKFHQLRDVP